MSNSEISNFVDFSSSFTSDNYIAVSYNCVVLCQGNLIHGDRTNPSCPTSLVFHIIINTVNLLYCTEKKYYLITVCFLQIKSILESHSLIVSILSYYLFFITF